MDLWQRAKEPNHLSQSLLWLPTFPFPLRSGIFYPFQGTSCKRACGGNMDASVNRWAKAQLKIFLEGGFDYHGILRGYHDSDQSDNEWYNVVHRHARPYSAPWQALPEEARLEAVKKQKRQMILGPFQPAAVIDVELLWNTFSKELQAIRSSPTFDPNKDDSDGMALHEETRGVRSWDEKEDCRVVAAFVIDFKRYSNKDILRKFSDWLIQNRPPGWPERIKRGKKQNDALVALESLGIMRAFNRFKWSDPRFPQIFKRKGVVACYKARQRALRSFHNIFPFLPKTEFPISWPTVSRPLIGLLP
jgi:hypothetical protein